VFYNDFDAYLHNNNVIKLLIAAFRKESTVQPIDKTAFIDYNVEKFLNAAPRHRGTPVVICRISDALALIYDRIHESTLGISPYTDVGKLQRDFQCYAPGIRSDTQEILRILHDTPQQALGSHSLATAGISTVANEEIVDCTPAVEAIK
jgi:hypothetical protein